MIAVELPKGWRGDVALCSARDLSPPPTDLSPLELGNALATILDMNSKPKAKPSKPAIIWGG